MTTQEKLDTLKIFFSAEELAVIGKCIEEGHYNFIPTKLGDLPRFNMTPDKEKAIDMLLKTVRPAQVFESTVFHEIRMKELQGWKIETQEEEAFWQKKIDDEKAAFLAKAQAEGRQLESEIFNKVDMPIAQDDMSEVDVEGMTKMQIMEELRTRNIKFDQAKTKSELFALLSQPVV